MAFRNIDEIKQQGFVGFKKISELSDDSAILPRVKGVYLVLYLEKNSPEFLETGTGGHFKKKDPNVTLQELQQNWIAGSLVVYIGKAGGADSKATLQSRLRQYFQFGQTKNIGHWGGRYIWQLRNSKNLVVCWKELPALAEDPRTIEAGLIHDFVSEFDKRPFANRVN